MSPSVFDPQLESIAVARTALSDIDVKHGELLVGGYSVEELAANATYEEAVHLLFEGRLPTEEELRSFRADLAKRRSLPERVATLLHEAAEAETPVMDALRMGMAAASLGESADDPETQARRAVAVLPTIVATYWRYRQGTEPVDPRGSLGHAANYLRMLTGEDPDEAAVRGLETYLNTVVDHGLNASTFTARTVVSTESDVISGVTAAIGALKGPLHGGAPGPVLDMLREIQDQGDPQGYVDEKLAAGERLMGFGHRVYRVRDPRAAVLSTAAERFYAAADDEALYETARAFEEVAVDRLGDAYPDRRLDTNVEFYTAVLLAGVGIPQELFTATFAVSRVGGWTAHAMEQLADNRLVRPVGRYVGESGRSWTPIARR